MDKHLLFHWKPRSDTFNQSISIVLCLRLMEVNVLFLPKFIICLHSEVVSYELWYLCFSVEHSLYCAV